MSKETVLKELIKILLENPILPGGIREVKGRCGKAICRCKDSKNPILHGPYNILSYSLSQKSSTMSIDEKEVFAANEMINHFRKAKDLLNQLSIEYIEEARESSILGLKVSKLEKIKQNKLSKLEKEKSKKQSQKNEKNRIRTKNLERSRNNFKNKLKVAKEEITSLKKQLLIEEKKIVKPSEEKKTL